MGGLKVKDFTLKRRLNLDAQAAKALGKIALALSRKDDTKSIELLENAQAEISTNDKPEIVHNALLIGKLIKQLELSWREQNIYKPLKNFA